MVEVDGQYVGLGRVPVPDARDGNYPMRAALGPIRARTGHKVWMYDFPSLNQGSDGTCVGHGWKHFLLTEPLVQSAPDGDPTAVGIYDRATEIDEFPGNDGHDRSYGTSVRAGAEVLREKGLLAEYRHAQSLQDMVDWVMDRGPVVIGVNWYQGMTYTSMFDGAFLVPTGSIVGGHCVNVQAVNCDEQHFMIRNSWGPTWGPWKNGMGLIRWSDMERLLFREGGDCLAGLEIPLGPTPPGPSPAPTGLTFTDAENAANDAYNLMRPGSKYNSTYYRKLGAKTVVDAIATRKAQG